MKFENVSEAISYFGKSQAEIVMVEQKLKDLMTKYKEETKDYFGVADGEPINLVQLASIFSRVSAKTLISSDVTGAAV